MHAFDVMVLDIMADATSCSMSKRGPLSYSVN